jgi:hypothetical protein
MTWKINSAKSEDVWFLEHLSSILNKPKRPLPPKKSVLGKTEVFWQRIDPGIAVVASRGGTSDDRYLAEQIVVSQLEEHGLERAKFSFDYDEAISLRRTSDWDDIENKAKRLVQSGNVTIMRNGYNNIVAHVVGDHGEYDVEIGRDDPNSRAITQWTCDCPWSQFSWGRTRQWKKYEGRPCAHTLAAFWQSQATPLDADAAGQPPTPGQMGPQPQSPADIAQPAPTGADVLPPSPTEQLSLMQPPAPGQTPAGMPAPPNSVSVPGARQPTPFNPVQIPSTYSSWREASDWQVTAQSEFNNGDMVRLEEAEMGVMEGKDPAHGAGGFKEIPAKSIGEVISQDETTGFVDVIFAGPQAEAGPLEPYHVQAYIEPNKLTLMPNIKPPGPFIRRR